MARVEVITGPERRRCWSAEQKRAIVAESLAPGAVVTEIARRAEIGPGQIGDDVIRTSKTAIPAADRHSSLPRLTQSVFRDRLVLVIAHDRANRGFRNAKA